MWPDRAIYLPRIDRNCDRTNNSFRLPHTSSLGHVHRVYYIRIQVVLGDRFEIAHLGLKNRVLARI